MADFGEEFVEVGGLSYEVDEEVVGCYEFCTLYLADTSEGDLCEEWRHLFLEQY